ncbi:PIN domain-containing protein [Pseudomonas sp. MYb2]|uniref:PIN domain-containing protein n=1 Tax=unclassified Pseudomonas TaxID=196821 RepID=UPI000D00B597|nr:MULTISPECIES: PIN domain-containing protein [unclassified Pseudomonas]PRB41527.1 PIN domain-containing protein [Pseudomonas sp. MYb3]PRC24481.1 PIN domain-containing protein [Pseudomonas sp. MYb2]
MRHSSFTAVYDACVLYPAPLRDFLMWLALSGLFRARWTKEIHGEWKRNLLKNRTDLTIEQLDRTSELMDQAIPDACVYDYENLVSGLSLPDLDDRHVLAAAIRCNAGVIVTFNLKDFPDKYLAPFGIEAQHPDEFVENLFHLDSAAVVAAAQHQRKQLKTPTMDVESFLNLLQRQGLKKSIQALGSYRAIL